MENPHGQRSLAGYNLWGCKDLDMTEQLSTWHNTYASKVMLKILQARGQQYVNQELPDVQAGFRKGRGPEIKLPKPSDHKKAREFQKKSTSVSLTTLKPLTVWITTNWNILKQMEIPDHLTCLLRNLYAGQEATVGKEYIKAVYCHPAYLTYM